MVYSFCDLLCKVIAAQSMAGVLQRLAGRPIGAGREAKRDVLHGSLLYGYDVVRWLNQTPNQRSR